MVNNPGFLVSVVVPVYNVERYLDQCIQSIINQDIGFANIQLVLINDGSKDGSGDMCQRYAEKYPDNIVYVKQRNAGVSEARNVGIKKSTGSLIGFVDADDYLSGGVVSGVLEYFDNNQDDADVAITRVIQFGHYTAERSINTKFNTGTKTIDLTKPEWFDINARVAPAFIKADIAKKYAFSKEVGIYEDTRYITEILSRKMKLGVVSKGVYYNRIHSGDVNASITTGAAKEKRFYMDSPEKVSLYLLKKFKDKNEYPPLYIQYVALYEMRWRLFYNPHNPKDILSGAEYDIYRRINRDILSLISDQAIIDFKMYSIGRRIFLLDMKYGKDIIKESKINADNDLVWRDVSLFNYDNAVSTVITDVFLSKKKINITGFFSVPLVKSIKVGLDVDGKDGGDLMSIHRNKSNEIDDYLVADNSVHAGDWFTIQIPVNSKTAQSFDIILEINGSPYIAKRISLAGPFRYSYGYRGDYGISKKIGGFIVHPTNHSPVAGWAVAKARYLVKLVRRAFGKAKRICIQMIRTLR